MPYMTNDAPCSHCGRTGRVYRQKWSSANKKYYAQKTCIDCEKQRLYRWRAQNKDKLATISQRAYVKKHGAITRNMNHTEESRKQWQRDKSNRRCGRAKLARRIDELTVFVTSEAHELRKLRNHLSGFEWHVDHVVPLNGKNVCGLHVWSNLAVIPKLTNLRKGNYHPIHDQR